MKCSLKIRKNTSYRLKGQGVKGKNYLIRIKTSWGNTGYCQVNLADANKTIGTDRFSLSAFTNGRKSMH